MTRDFSEKAKQKLEGYADDAAASSTWGKIKDWFSDRGMDFWSWAGKLGAGDTSCKKSSDPVNLSTGNFIYDHEDMRQAERYRFHFTDTTTQRIPAPAQRTLSMMTKPAASHSRKETEAG